MAEIRRRERSVAELRSLAKVVRADLGRAWPLVGPDYYAPRKWKGAHIQIPDTPIPFSDPELEPLPDMLERYASCVEQSARLQRQCAKLEPTEKQWRQDMEDRVLRCVKDFTGRCYRAHVADILEALRPGPIRTEAAGTKSETLRKREFRRRKSAPSPDPPTI